MSEEFVGGGGTADEWLRGDLIPSALANSLKISYSSSNTNFISEAGLSLASGWIVALAAFFFFFLRLLGVKVGVAAVDLTFSSVGRVGVGLGWLATLAAKST